MFFKSLKIIRNKFHPLWHLRSYGLFRIIQRYVDIPISVHLYNIDWKVSVRLMRHMSWIFNSEFYEPRITSLILAIDKVIKPKIFWDIGANIGYYSWLLMSHNKDIEVVLFEPDSDNIQLLRRTIKCINLDKAQIIGKAVSDKNGNDIFLVDDISSMVGRVEEASKSKHEKAIYARYGLSKTVVVETIKLDSLQGKLRPPDLIKIDAEGAEKRIIKGGIELIKRNHPILILECQYSPDRGEIVSMLGDLNYDVLNADNLANSPDAATHLLALPLWYKNIREELFNECRNELKNRAGV